MTVCRPNPSSARDRISMYPPLVRTVRVIPEANDASDIRVMLLRPILSDRWPPSGLPNSPSRLGTAT